MIYWRTENIKNEEIMEILLWLGHKNNQHLKALQFHIMLTSSTGNKKT
jgi:hypothetical protein